MIDWWMYGLHLRVETMKWIRALGYLLQNVDDGQYGVRPAVNIGFGDEKHTKESTGNTKKRCEYYVPLAV